MYIELVLRGLKNPAALDKSLHCTFEQPTTERRHACQSTPAVVTACQRVSTGHGTRHPQVFFTEKFTHCIHPCSCSLIMHLSGDSEMESFSYSGNGTIGEIITTNTLNCLNTSTSL